MPSEVEEAECSMCWEKLSAAPPADADAASPVAVAAAAGDVTVTSCGHAFHSQCITQWESTCSRGAGAATGEMYRCPTCRCSYLRIHVDVVSSKEE